MTVAVTCIDPGMNLSFAWTVMQELRVRHLPVIEGEKLLGMVSQRDLMLHGTPKKDGTLSFPDLTAAEVMATQLHTAGPGATVSQVADIMVKQKVGSVPIVGDHGELVGLVTYTDLLQLLVDPEPGARVLPFTWALHKRQRGG
jgi:CBS domain-containing protein